MIYLDNAATTFPKPDCVYKAMDETNRNLAFNAGRGSYQSARKATQMIDETKTQLLALVNSQDNGHVVFAPSITIAINQILNGIEYIDGDNIYVSPYEHNAVARVVNLIKKLKNVNIVQMPLDENTLEIDIEKLKYLFVKHPPKCVCCIHVSNVTGYILPVEEIFAIAKQYDAITVLDTAQSLGLIDVDAKKMNADFIAFAGHKSLYGPLGIGGFITFGKIPLKEYIVGGTGSNSLNLDMPAGFPEQYEFSSQNIVAIAGLNATLKDLDAKQIYQHEKELIEYLVEKLKNIPEVVTYIPPVDKHIGIVSFNIQNYKADDVGMILDEDYDIAVRTGYHCSPYIHKYLRDDGFLGTVRVGVGRFTTREEMDVLIACIQEIII